MSDYLSDTLFHFVGRRHPLDDEANYALLRDKILATGRISHPPHTPDGSATAYVLNFKNRLVDGELLVPTVVCFADIPSDKLGRHVAKYGKFGVGFDRRVLARFGARPVMYFPVWQERPPSTHGSELARDIECALRAFKELVVEPIEPDPSNQKKTRYFGQPATTRDAAIQHMRAVVEKDFLAFLKPFNAMLEADDPDYFYSEREWRKYGYFNFGASEVARIAVATGYGARLEADLPAYSGRVFEID